MLAFGSPLGIGDEARRGGEPTTLTILETKVESFESSRQKEFKGSHDYTEKLCLEKQLEKFESLLDS